METSKDGDLLEMPPMPMDGPEGLAEFASAGKGQNDIVNSNSGAVAVESKSSEGYLQTQIVIILRILEYLVTIVFRWYARLCPRWIPTSPQAVEAAEKKVLSYVKTAYEGKFVDIGSVENKSNCKLSFWSKPEERKVWTLAFNKEADTTPMVVVHGLCASAGLWSLNIDALAESRPLYAIDLIGFGRSSRPRFSKDAAEAEAQHVEAIEAWRKEMGLEKFILLGHSMGGFISTGYALKYPDRVAHLVLADPWGFPQKPEKVSDVLPIKNSFRVKAITTLGQMVNPLALVRGAGPFGPGLIGKARPDLVSKFEALNQNGSASVAEYIYHSNAQNPTGEEAFRTMMDFFGWAKNPMVHRLPELPSSLPLTMIYGDNTWLQQLPEETVKSLRSNDNANAASTEVHVVPGAGHHVYADNQSMFNSIVNKAGALADKFFNPLRIPS